MTITDDAPRRLPKGANVALRELEGGLGSVTVVLETRTEAERPVEADVSVLLLGADGRVRSGDDLVFYNQPIALGGAVHLRDKARLDSVEQGAVTSIDVVTLDLDDVPDAVERIVVSASVDGSAGTTFGDVAGLGMRVQRTADAHDLLTFDIADATAETALLVGEFYRRDGEWRVRAVGQGYAGGFAALVADYGVEVDSAGNGDEQDIDGAATPISELDLTPDLSEGAMSAPPDELEESLPDVGEQPAIPRPVSVRRPSRAPKFPAAWDETIPAADGNDWQRARLFPVAGIGRGEEQERRATSALLAVMSTVREFGRALTSRYGAPAGAIATYVEVPFGQDEEAYRPDGLVRITRGAKEWTALVEVKTADGRLKTEQIDHYVDIARARSFDAVITISNELTGADVDHPVSIDRRKLRNLALVHVSWDQIRTEALLLARHRGVPDATQQHVLEEFIRYMNHPGSGMAGLTDMGQNWVKVRDGVKAKTARSTDKPTADVSARFDQLIQHVGLQLSSMLGVSVQPVAPRNAPDNASRCQQLADSGLLFGCLRVPGAVDLIILNADLRADRVGASITVQAPRGDTRPATRVSWLLRQLPDAAHDMIRVEALLGGRRGDSTVELLGKLRSDPAKLLPADQSDIRAFRLSLDLPMGTKRASGTGTLIHSIKAVSTTFYADVVQHLRSWTPPPRA
ncbi:TerD family protein [uncultured Jatrophihabitans sp.]|uniref:TerD family protein n=1 Tax=uncultured Jatrophihabitans sp. TaxID=1610747 RepID=UPI0035CA205B